MKPRPFAIVAAELYKKEKELDDMERVLDQHIKQVRKLHLEFKALQKEFLAIADESKPL